MTSKEKKPIDWVKTRSTVRFNGSNRVSKAKGHIYTKVQLKPLAKSTRTSPNMGGTGGGAPAHVCEHVSRQ